MIRPDRIADDTITPRSIVEATITPNPFAVAYWTILIGTLTIRLNTICQAAGRPTLIRLAAICLTMIGLSIGAGIGLSIGSTMANASDFVPPADNDYLYFDDPGYRIIFTEDHQRHLPDLLRYNRYLLNAYTASFGWKFDERADLVLTSRHAQIANGFATVIPNLRTVFYLSGSELLETFAQRSWALALLSHETAHLYQLNAKQQFNSLLKQVLGNPLYFGLAFIPVFIHPNFFTPAFIMEGNAVFNESRLGLGGRLHSGEIRAQVLAQIKEDTIRANELMNNTLEYPFGSETYHQGGYMQSHLAQRFGTDHVNHFFVAQGGHFFLPLILNSTFRDHYGESYSQSIREYQRALMPLAQKQQSPKSSPHLTAFALGPMNHDSQQVWFLLNDTLQTLSQLVIINKNNLQLTTRPTDLPFGKVFHNAEANQWQTAASLQHQIRDIQYSLYDEELNPDPRFFNQLVTDQRAGQTISQDMVNSFWEPQALLNGQPFSTVHSLPILDEQGQVYYFLQSGDQRTVYRNKEQLFSYRGYYGKLMEVDAQQRVFFIANTEAGSTLFVYDRGKIWRVLDADTVIEARHLSGDLFLVHSTGAKKLSVHVEKANYRSQLPTHYEYATPQVDLLAQGSSITSESLPSAKTYQPPWQLRYSATDAALTYYDASVFGSASFTFTDPMNHNVVQLGIIRPIDEGAVFDLSYTNSQYLVSWFIGANGSEGDKYDPYEFSARAGVDIPLWRKRRWSSNWLSSTVWKNYDDIYDTSRDSWHLINQFNLSRIRRELLAQSPNSYFSLSPKNVQTYYQSQHSDDESSSALDLSFGGNVLRELHLSGQLSAAVANADAIKLGFVNPLFSDEVEYQRLNPSGTDRVSRLYLARSDVRRAFITTLTGPRLPLGLRRTTPFANIQYLNMQEVGVRELPKDLLEGSIGCDLEVLLAHRIPVHLTIAAASSQTHSHEDSRTFSIMTHLKYKSDF